MFHISHKSLSTQTLYLIILPQVVPGDCPNNFQQFPLLSTVRLSVTSLSHINTASFPKTSTSFWSKLFTFHFSLLLSGISSGSSPLSPSMPLVLYIFLPTSFTTSLPPLLLPSISSGLSLGSATMPLVLYVALPPFHLSHCLFHLHCH